MADMKAVRLHDPLDLRYETVAMAPMPQQGEVRVSVAYAGICGSDIHNYKTGAWITRKPSIAGHEFSGWVDAIGTQVTGFNVGDKVVADSRYYCGRCFNCLCGRANLCDSLGFVGEAIDGGFAEYVTLPAHLLVKCATDSRLDVLALAEPLAVALHALKAINIPDDEPLMIIGCGPIGALIAVAAQYHSKRTLFVSDVNKTRLLRTAELSDAKTVELEGFRQFENASGKPLRFVIDTTGHVDVINALIRSFKGFTLGLVGIGSGTLNLQPSLLVEREIKLVGCHAFDDELREATDMLQALPQAFEGIVGETTTLDQTLSCYETIASGRSTAIKTLIKVAA